MRYILWSPWRMKYVERASRGVEECIFCRAVTGDEKENWVVHKTKYSIIMLNAFPYNTAHVMIAPKRHVPRLELLSDEEILDLNKSLILAIKAIDIEYKPHGYNIGINIGKVAGAGIEAHLHIHVVPRWLGDTNFMPVIGNVKVIPEDLNRTYERIRKAISKVLSTRDF